MKPVVQLVRIAHGSHTFGTSTPLSDQNFKGIHLSNGEAILLQRAEEVDEQSFPLQKFFAQQLGSIRAGRRFRL